MKKWIRWKGIFVFVGITLFILIIWLIFADAWIERAIEKTGTRIVGAQVELDDADLTLFPMGLALSKLQITDPDKPLTNALEASRIAFTFDTLNLFRRRVIIEEMAVEGVQFDTPRKTSGAIRKPAVKREKSRKPPLFTMPSFTVPDIKEILKKEKLETLELLEILNADIMGSKEKWQNRLSELPDQKTFEQYQKKFKEIQKQGSGGLTGALGTVGEIAKVQQELSQDIKLIEQSRKEFTGEMKSLQKKLNQVKNAPQADIRRILNKYSLTPKGLAHMSQILFGPKIASYVEKALLWYEKIKPVLEREKSQEKTAEVVKPMRGKGVNVRFREKEPLPDFLARKAEVTLQLEAGNVSGTIENITPDQDILMKPLEFIFSGDKLKGITSIEVDGTLNHIDPKKNNDVVNVTVKGYKVRKLKVSESESLPLSLSEGNLGLTLRTAIRGEELDAHLQARLDSVMMQAGERDDSNPLMNALQSALSDVKQFSIDADISGTLADYNVKITSDIDKVLKDALSNQVKKQSKTLENKLTKEITGIVNKPMKETSANFAGLNLIRDEISSRLKFGDSVFKGSEKSAPGGLKLPF